MTWQENLRDKYWELFSDELRGIECGKGWEWLIDGFCDKLHHYINSSDYIKKFCDYDLEIGHSSFHETKIIPKEPEKVPQVKITTIKEKFGVLSIYVDNADDIIWAYISLAATLSTKTCEFCGSHKYMGTTSGWIRHLCKDCGEKDRNPWKPDKDYTAEIRAEKLKQIGDEK